MSVQAITWLLERAPDVKPHLVGTLFGLANHADQDGRAAHPSVGLLSHYNRKTDRATQNDLRELEHDLDLIRRGDQRRVMHIPEDRRPVVYDLAMAYAPERVRPARVTEGKRGRPRKNGVQSTSPGEVEGENGVKPSTKRGAVGFTQTVLEPTTRTSSSKITARVVGQEEEGGSLDVMAEALLAALPRPFAVGPKTRDVLRPAVVAALRAGWAPADLTAHLTRNPHNVRNAGALLGKYLGDLPDAPAVMPPDDPRDPWCGACDERTRLVYDPDDGPTRRCQNCHPHRNRRAS